MNIRFYAPAPLDGEVPEGEIVAFDKDKNKREISQVVFPILSITKGKEKLLGTGFFIAKGGLFLTAKHVLADNLNKKGDPIGDLFICQFLEGKKIIRRYINHFYFPERGDLALGACFPREVDKDDGPSIDNSVLTLTTTVPKRETEVYTFAYAKTLRFFSQPENKEIIEFYPAFYNGKLKEHHPNGRDPLMMPTECFETSMRIYGGASGGPVFNEEGFVFAINSTGWENTDLSYISSIKDILKMALTEVITSPSNQLTNPTISELVKKGFIVFKS